jgi:hypothetical protein
MPSPTNHVGAAPMRSAALPLPPSSEVACDTVAVSSLTLTLRTMRTDGSMGENQLTLPADMLESVLHDAGRLANEAEQLLAPVVEQRDHLRSVLVDADQIISVPEPTEQVSLAAVDGGSVVDQMYAADRLVIAALVAEGMRTSRTGELHHATWTGTFAHQLDLDRLSDAVMICLELQLLHGINYQLKIFDGSHQTPIIALNSALSSRNPAVRALAAEIVHETGAVEALRSMCDDTTGSCIVALPKADPSTEFCWKYRRDYQFTLPPITDRFLATQVLEPGEMLVPRKPENWHGLHIQFRQNIEDGEEEEDPAKQRLVETTAGELDEAIEPLRHCREAGHGVGITYLKPHRSNTCVKIEFKASKGKSHGLWLAGILSAEAVSPHMQEPYAQFVADLWAKNISMAADALGAAIRHRLSSDETWSQYLMLGYRSGTTGGHR